MRINHNLMALNTHRQLAFNNVNTQKSMEKLSSGLRINRAGDDAAGLAISEKMRAQIRGLDMASKNAQDGISLIQTAEGALNESHAILQRMNELAVQAASDTNTDSDRAELQKEVNQLVEELSRIANDTEFNTMNLLDGSFNDKVFHIGANAGQNIIVSISNMDADSLGLIEELTAATGAAGDTITINGEDVSLEDVSVLRNAAGDVVAVYVAEDTDSGREAGYYAISDLEINNAGDDDNPDWQISGARAGATPRFAAADNGDALADGDTVDAAIDISSQESADKAITTIAAALESVSAQRSNLGAVQNRLEHTINNLGTSSENLTAAESRIRDVDMAKEMMEFTKNNILAQAANAMLAQPFAA